MKLDQLRQQLAVPVDAADAELFAEMWQAVQHMADGQFLPTMGEILARYEQDQPIRPHFPNKMQYIYMRDRQTFTLALFPQLLPFAYQAGRAIGAAFDAPRRTGITLPEALSSAIDVPRLRLWTPGDRHRRRELRHLPHLRVRRLLRPAQLGAEDLRLRSRWPRALERTLGRPVRVEEVKCCANGDPYDEFHIFVL
ncbi:MAG: hypothetical protein R2873_10425 [Caldilineaceae bacterium]